MESGVESREETYELTRYNDIVESPEIHSLPPADGGKAAWMTLIGCFCLESVVWGYGFNQPARRSRSNRCNRLPFSYGVFQEYYSSHEPFQKNSSRTAAISTTAIAIMFFASPCVALVIQRWPWVRFRAGLCGLALMDAALLVSSFCSSVSVLLATQGVLYAVGGLILYFPAMYFIDECFIARKGLAIAIVWTGTYAGGAGVPFLLQWLLKQYGFATAIRVWTVVLVSLQICVATTKQLMWY